MATKSIATEYLSWDNVETVQVIYSIEGYEQPEKTLDYALRVNPADKRSSYQGVRTSARQVSFWLPVAEFGTKEPDGNMVIEDSAGEKYNLDDSKLVILGSSESHWDVLATRQQSEY